MGCQEAPTVLEFAIVTKDLVRAWTRESLSYPNLAILGTPIALTEVTPAPPEEALSATLIIHVYLDGGPLGAHCYGTNCPDEAQPLRITRLGANGEALSTAETQHAVQVAPGQYEISGLDGRGGGPLGSTKVSVSACQELEVMLGLSVP